jgi:hypothetical protein
MPVVWWGSLVEVHSAIARLYRLGDLKDVEKQGALSRIDLLSRGWREILPGDHVRDLAKRLLDAHELRAADNLQLRGSPDLVPITRCEKRLRLCRSTIIQSGNNRRLLGVGALMTVLRVLTFLTGKYGSFNEKYRIFDRCPSEKRVPTGFTNAG